MDEPFFSGSVARYTEITDLMCEDNTTHMHTRYKISIARYHTASGRFLSRIYIVIARGAYGTKENCANHLVSLKGSQAHRSAFAFSPLSMHTNHIGGKIVRGLDCVILGMKYSVLHMLPGARYHAMVPGLCRSVQNVDILRCCLMGGKSRRAFLSFVFVLCYCTGMIYSQVRCS